ncbi:translocation/assembly module TamB domain-containing protein [Flavobacterium wongokense]|uniref:translocation/assembly module TamB domain-containing protein n=1 Tax=Flavobacterium wongokense TaxID=2910674 RepID=UPI001F372120|nr:translocation/assembly module TamB domain-containing protein [Flavobacterium sp. WG47]MCF6132292.1 translocation/assembly module TamB domain-containing protein [Flavobacterium sp. WG47]
MLSLIGLVLLAVIALQIPAVQNYAKGKAVAYLEDKLKTKVVVNKLQIAFPKDVTLQGVYFEDQKKDTLLSGKKIAANINLYGILFGNKVEINSVELDGIVAHVDRNKDNIFNFNYIIEAFKSPEKQDDNSPPMEFLLDKIKMDNVRIRYNDVYSNNNLKLNINHLDTRLKTFDLNQMNFEVPRFKIDGMQFSYKQGLVGNVVEPKTAKSKSPDLKLKLGTLDLSKIKVDYQDDNSKITTNIGLDKLLVKVNAFDLKTNTIDLDKIELSNANGGLALGKIPTQEDKKTAGSKSNWKVKVNEVAFEKVNFTFDNANGDAVQKGIDYRHLGIKNLNLGAERIAYNAQTISGKINAMKAEEKSGVKIESFKTDFYYGEKTAYLKDLYFKTPQSTVRNEIVIGYPSIESLSKNPGGLIVNANLNQSKIGFKDILLFAPELSNTNPFKSNPNAVVLLDTKISGKLSNLNFPKLQLSGIGATKVNASGWVVGLPDFKKAYFNLNIKNLQSSAKDVYAFVPKNTIPTNIQLPSQFSTKGTFRGTINNFSTNMDLATSSGNAKIKGSLDRRIKNREKYNLDAALDNFDLGRFLKNDSIGKITLKTEIKGTGFNPKTANAVANATIIKANYNHYTYQNLVVDGKINNGAFNANAFIKDPNLKFDLVSSGSFKDKYPKGEIHLNVDIADLNKLNLHAGPLKLRGELDADIQSADIDFLNGKASIHHLLIANDKEQFATDSINVVAVATAEKNSITLDSQFMDAEFVGKYRLSTLANSVKNSVSHYYNLKATSKNVPYGPQQLAFKVNVKSTPLLLKIVPAIKSIEPIALSGRYNSVNDTIVLNGSIPKLVYGNNTIANGMIKIDTKDDALVYNLSVDEIRNNQFLLHRTSFSGTAAKDLLDYTLLVKDYNNKDRYLIAGNLKSQNGGSEIWLDPKKLLLNYDNWKLSEDNRIRISDRGIYVTNFDLRKGDSSVIFESQNDGYNPPLEVDFRDFEIKTIADIVQMKNLEMNGLINGNVVLKDLMSKVLFTATVSIDDFTFKKELVGNINVNVDNYTANTYTAKIELTGQENQMNLDGTYQATADNLNMNLDIQKLNLKSVQGFSMENIKEGTGYFTGNMKVYGNAGNPKLVGDLKFNEIGFKATKLNAKFKSMNDKLVFTENAILLDNFTIYDEKNNDLVINGKVDNTNYTNLGFDLTVDADNFKAVNSKAKDNDTFYGELYLDNHLTVKGSMDSPYVEGNIKINKDTKFTVVLPQDDPSIADREGIVEFIDQDQPQLFTKVPLVEATAETEVKGINATVNIEIDKDAEISMIIDKGNGDYLKMKGEAQLSGGIDPSGKTTLTGRYALEEGSYEMSFNLIKRKFDIKKGSYILWTGEPTTADINIIAVYKLQTAPIDLLNDQLTALTPEERNTYKQKIPFETELKMTGELLKPNITFDIILPEGNNSVSSDIITKTEAKLAQLRQEPDDLNKQVFALLLLNRFIGEDPFSSESGGTTASSLARESASKVLSQQLNNLASDLIKGFEVDFDLDSSEDYTTGQKENKTDLNVGLSKKLLNDRLKVTVGSTFGIEGPEQVNKETNTIAGDIAAEYQISKDGRYKVRAYRKNLYQVALQGQVIETGVGFIITLDYNKFRELFHSKKDTDKPKKAKKKTND